MALCNDKNARFTVAAPTGTSCHHQQERHTTRSDTLFGDVLEDPHTRSRRTPAVDIAPGAISKGVVLPVRAVPGAFSGGGDSNGGCYNRESAVLICINYRETLRLFLGYHFLPTTRHAWPSAITYTCVEVYSYTGQTRSASVYSDSRRRGKDSQNSTLSKKLVTQPSVQ